MTGSSIDADALAELAAIGCTEAEAAAWLGVPADALACVLTTA